MDEDPFPGWGLRPVELTDRGVIEGYFGTLSQPLSDYTFSQLYSWRNSLRILWTELHGHLCVFANGAGDLTLLMPPIGEGGALGDRALGGAFEMMDAYNAGKGVPDRSRVEYASEELVGRLGRAGLEVRPLGADYVYDVRRMIDLAGGDLASKRQARNRFMRNYVHRVEGYDPARHLDGCLGLLSRWKSHQDDAHVADGDSATVIKRAKESTACELSLRTAGELGLKGMVVYVGDSIAGFTFGEELGRDQSSIVIEKTDLEAKGLAQFIFSEFCGRYWGHRPLCNVGDDWGIESLAWTKMSYRPVHQLQKYVLRRVKSARVAVGTDPVADGATAGVAATTEVAARGGAGGDAVVRAALKSDVDAAVELEQACFSSFCLTKRQLRYLQGRSTAVFLVAEAEGAVIGEGIALVRRSRGARREGGAGLSGRIYSLAVSGSHRGRQVGRRLLEAMVGRLEERGVKRVFLEVEKGNGAAIRLYERNGFRAIGELPDYYGTGKDGLHMMRELSAVGAKVA